MHKNIQILDCTLRDGGYVNDFNFGKNSIRIILKKLGRSKIDIIECGFLADKGGDENSTIFGSVEAIEAAIGEKEPGRMYVAMVDLGEKEVPLERIAPNNGKTIDGIRITCREHQIDRVVEYAKALQEKGYKPFIQPIGTAMYSDNVLIDLISKMNELKPFAFYIVDSFGTMYKKDLLRLFYLIDHNLDPAVAIGFHSHNNLQLAFSNAQELLTLHTKRTILIDSSVFGMGRGAGNLCSELITRYINDNIENTYKIEPLLEIIDEQLFPILARNTWGYSVPYYLAAVNNCHPNYAAFLLNKQTLTIPVINRLLTGIPMHKRAVFDRDLITAVYNDFQQCHFDDRETRQYLADVLDKRPILLIGPGNTIDRERLRIAAFIANHDPFVISINFIPRTLQPDYVFMSNRKRWEQLNVDSACREQAGFIFSSNIQDLVPADGSTFVIDYSGIACEVEGIRDNAGLMMINMLISLGIRSVHLAGFDGFADNSMFSLSSADEDHLRTEKISRELLRLNESIAIGFVTTSLYDTKSADRRMMHDAA